MILQVRGRFFSLWEKDDIGVISRPLLARRVQESPDLGMIDIGSDEKPQKILGTKPAKVQGELKMCGLKPHGQMNLVHWKVTV